MSRSDAVSAAVISVPLIVCGLIAATLKFSGEQRILQLGIALPAAFVVAGASISVLLTLLVGVRSRRRAHQRMISDARTEGKRDGELSGKEAHRRFLARLDHELKNPLTAIRAAAGFAADGSPAWRTVEDQSRKMSALVRDLRKLAELESRTLEREITDLEELVRDAVEAVGDYHPEARERITFSVSRVPWPVPHVDIDADLVSLAIDNVLSNAAKYSPSGPIEVRMREQHGWAIVEVADQGRGIPAADLSQVFDELCRATNAIDVPGTGLGLTLVATVMRRHGGQATIRSQEGHGSVVELRLPTECSS